MSNKVYLKNNAIIVDIDGTLTDNSLLIKASRDEDPRGNRDYFMTKYNWYNINTLPCSEIPLREAVVNIVKMEIERRTIPFFVTAREEAISPKGENTRENTLAFLKSVFGPEIAPEQLLMRTYNDFSPNYEVKEALYNDFIKNRYNVLYCLEDEDHNADMFRRNGLLVLKVLDTSLILE